MKKYTNFFFNEYFSNFKKMQSKTIKLTRLSDNIVDLNPTPLYINPKIAHYEKINYEINEIVENLSNSIDIKNYNDQDTKFMNFFTTQGARTTNVSIMDYDAECIRLLHSYLKEGISDILKTVYNYSNVFNIEIRQSNIHSYSDSTFISPHTHIILNNGFLNNTHMFFSAAYYVEDGDPDENKTHSGCITFITNDRPYHVKPISGSLLIWESNLLHCVNPFYSKSDKKRMVITVNINVLLENFF
jgi:hypothetical protein